jgi:protein gp37
MGKNSAIEWTDNTWNPWRGCHKVSAGCKNCYMYREQKRYGNDPATVIKAADATFYAPLKWGQPAFVFTCSWSDFFITEADIWRSEAWEVIRKTPHLTYQILTKRPENILGRLPADWPLPNVWLGVSAENQQAANERIPLLLTIPAEIHFVSCEPLLGPVTLGMALYSGLNWVIAGGESGAGHRPCQPDWVCALRDECTQANTPFFFKQWGGTQRINGIWGGNILDSKTWDERPEVYNWQQPELPIFA